MRSLSDFVIRTSRSLPLFVLAAILGPAMLAFGLFPIMEAFQGIAGFAPFDWQPELERATIAAEAPAYTPVLRKLYYAHAFIDFIFPVFMGVFFGASAALFLRLGLPDALAWCERRAVFAFFLITAVFDMTENVAALAVIDSADPGGLWASLLIGSKQAKLVVQQLVPLATGAATLLGLAGWIRRRVTG